MILVFAGKEVPPGYIWADGAVYLKVQYPELSEVLGNTYGGSGYTFCVPLFEGAIIKCGNAEPRDPREIINDIIDYDS
jgi:microcystin-dependent protein